MMLKFGTKIIDGRLHMITMAGKWVLLSAGDAFKTGVALNMRSNQGFPPIKFDGERSN